MLLSRYYCHIVNSDCPDLHLSSDTDNDTDSLNHTESQTGDETSPIPQIIIIIISGLEHNLSTYSSIYALRRSSVASPVGTGALVCNRDSLSLLRALSTVDGRRATSLSRRIRRMSQRCDKPDVDASSDVKKCFIAIPVPIQSGEPKYTEERVIGEAVERHANCLSVMSSALPSVVQLPVQLGAPVSSPNSKPISGSVSRDTMQPRDVQRDASRLRDHHDLSRAISRLVDDKIRTNLKTLLQSGDTALEVRILEIGSSGKECRCIGRCIGNRLTAMINFCCYTLYCEIIPLFFPSPCRTQHLNIWPKHLVFYRSHLELQNSRRTTLIG